MDYHSKIAWTPCGVHAESAYSARTGAEYVGHSKDLELTLNHISLNSYSILVGMESNELNTWKMAYSSDVFFLKY
jgi:hypothetical protein